MAFYCPMSATEYNQHLFLEILGQFYPAELQTVYPIVNLILIHGIEYLAELLDILITVFRWSHTFETVKFLIVEIEFLAVISFLTVGMPSATARVTAALIVVMMMFLLLRNLLSALSCHEIDNHYKHQTRNQK